MGHAVVFLTSDEAKFITSIDLPVDGGYLVLGTERVATNIPYEER
ncbi:hypothetical protein [Dictyobacter arantiisoli]